MRQGKITIYDIAQEAGVSAATVSRVLSGHPHVSAKTARRVQGVIDKYQFKPSSVARGLYHRTPSTIGIIMPGMENPYYASLFSAAYTETQKNGYAVLLYRTSPAEPLDCAFAGQLIERRLDGALVLGGTVESPGFIASVIPALNLLLRHMPLVTICPKIEGVACVNFHSDLAASVRQSVHHLHGLGHQRIAFLGGATESRSAGERQCGFDAIMAELGLKAAYHHETGHTAEAGELGVAKLLSSIARHEWPTAIISINDLVALGAMRQIKRMGLRIPEDFAIIGCDNQFFSPYTDPPLTTVDNHPADLGRLAIGQLLAQTAPDSRGHSYTQIRESTLIVRESCGVLLGRRALS